MTFDSCAVRVRRIATWAGLAVLLAAGNAAADPVTIPSSPTSLASTADRMISYRHQNHMWQTSDGTTHVLINRGTLPSGRALSLRSTFDGGTTWVASGIDIASTDLTSTSDGYVANDLLSFTYSDVAGDIKFAQARYNSMSKTWALVKTESVYASTTAVAMTPAVATDAMGRSWLAFTQQDTATSNYSIKMMWKASDTAAWTDTGFVFGAVDNLSNERAARPVVTSRGVGLIYTVHSNTYWAQRYNAWAPTATWPRSLIYTKQDPTTDPYGSHYSVASDLQNNLHLAMVDGGRVIYSRYSDSAQSWTTRVATNNISATYLQVLTAMDNVVIVTNSSTTLRVYQSIDSGTTFTYRQLLTHPAGTATVNYDRPRVEAPARSSTPIPVLQQYVDGQTQRAMFFAVPVVR